MIQANAYTGVYIPNSTAVMGNPVVRTCVSAGISEARTKGNPEVIYKDIYTEKCIGLT